MLLVIAKEIAREHCYHVIPSHCACIVRQGGPLGHAVRPVCAHIKELEGGKEGREDPEEPELGLGDPDFEDVEGNSHDEELGDCCVAPHEREIPDDEVVGGVIIWVGVVVRRMRMMQVVIAVQAPIVHPRIEHRADCADDGVATLRPNNGAVHGVVGRDEESGVDVGNERNLEWSPPGNVAR